ncbi:MAG: hypothetical protein J6X43_11030 [Bacteroidales bacterium]|nr:hypothetical protein [Bacteroidales bacterium]
MKKLIFSLCAILLVLSGCDKKNKFDEADLVGRWKSGTLWEKYSSSGTGATWDTADDIDEDEAQTFTWELEGEILTQYHQMEGSSGLVPRQITIKTLTASSLVYTKNGKTYTFTKQ